MVGYYRLRDLGFRLPSGAQILSKAQFEPVDAASALLAEAEAQAARVVAVAGEEFVREQLRGYQEGRERAQLEAVEWLLGEERILDQRLADIEKRIASVVIASVRRLIEGFDDRLKAESMVRSALRQMRRERRAELRVSPEQLADMKLSIGSIVADFPEVELVDVVEDATLVPPQIILETKIGRVEGDLGRSIERLEATVRATLANAGKEAVAPPDGETVP